jgi:hypothetical protein
MVMNGDDAASATPGIVGPHVPGSSAVETSPALADRMYWPGGTPKIRNTPRSSVGSCVPRGNEPAAAVLELQPQQLHRTRPAPVADLVEPHGR